MNWGRIFFVFTSLLSFAAIIIFVVLGHIVALFCAMAINFLATTLKIGVKKVLDAELIAASIAIDVLLIPAFFALQVWGLRDITMAFSYAALAVSVFSLLLILLESSKVRDDEREYQ